ncbi:hypothetical protein [Paenibacillus sp. Y412MC10]|uniref:hypothetical protein n=1 Tax=Geobacillus sp. (strain Y412MC10) TaxID=481743 RepID=UPI0011A18C40|nr:hypothetical protein [Paenibacillus sp. Y412MC10]
MSNEAEESPGDDKKNVYRRTFKEDRPHLAEVFLAIIEWFSFAEIYKFYNLKKNVYRRTFKEDRPRVAEVFLAIIEWFSFVEIYKFYNLKKSL